MVRMRIQVNKCRCYIGHLKDRASLLQKDHLCGEAADMKRSAYMTDIHDSECYLTSKMIAPNSAAYSCLFYCVCSPHITVHL